MLSFKLLALTSIATLAWLSFAIKSLESISTLSMYDHVRESKRGLRATTLNGAEPSLLSPRPLVKRVVSSNPPGIRSYPIGSGPHCVCRDIAVVDEFDKHLPPMLRPAARRRTKKSDKKLRKLQPK